MKQLLNLLVAVPLLVGAVPPAVAQLSFGMALSGGDIGVQLSTFPTLVQVPGYPVYYNPRGNSNYFFYDGFYWVLEQDNWYSSNWYNGPWHSVSPDRVPLFVLRVPVRYYRQPPAYFRGWGRNDAPRWGERWGQEWEQNRPGWNQWDRRDVPRAAPLPTYQRQYPASRYPRAEERQQEIHGQRYRYEPRDPAVQQRGPGQPEGAVRNDPRAPARVDAPRTPDPRPQRVELPSPPQVQRPDVRPVEAAPPVTRDAPRRDNGPGAEPDPRGRRNEGGGGRPDAEPRGQDRR